MNGPTQLETEAQRLADLNARESGIKTKESEIASREISVAAREKQATAERQAIEQDKAKLTQREQAVTQAEQKRDAGFAAERAALNDELREKRVQGEKEITHTRENKLTALEDEIARLKAKRLEAVAHAEDVERERIRAEIAKERDAWAKQQDDARHRLNSDRTEFEKQKAHFPPCKAKSKVGRRSLRLQSEHSNAKNSGWSIRTKGAASNWTMRLRGVLRIAAKR